MDPWHISLSKSEGPSNGINAESSTETTADEDVNLSIYQQLARPGNPSVIHQGPFAVPTTQTLHAANMTQSIPTQMQLQLTHRQIPVHIAEVGIPPYFASLEHESQVQSPAYNQGIPNQTQSLNPYGPLDAFHTVNGTRVPAGVMPGALMPDLESKPHSSEQQMHDTNALRVLSNKNTRLCSRSRSYDSQNDSPSEEDTNLTKTVIKRSRMGCLTCRQRKKRCCEMRPQCAECLKLGLDCVWPVPGTERRNKSRDSRDDNNTIEHEAFGKIRILRGIVKYKSK